MEFLRFGSSIPGSYWGCCAVCIIQNFKCDPDAPASIQLVSGDGGQPLNGQFLGKTYREVFLSRLRIGTFNLRDMPNHAFLAVLTEQQIRGGHGAKWLPILKEQGFEFLRCVDNSVYTGEELVDKNKRSSHKNYMFGLFRNVGAGSVDDQFTPPKEWTDLPSVVPEAWERISDRPKLTTEIVDAQLPLYKALGKPKFYTEQQLEAEGVPITLAGVRSQQPQRLKPKAESKPTSATKSAPFTVSDEVAEEAVALQEASA